MPYGSTRKVLLVQKSTIGTLASLGWYSRMLVGCVGTEEYYNSTVEVVLVEQSTIGAIERLCWCYTITREAVLLQQRLVQESTIGALRRLC